MGAEIEADQLGDEFKGYVLKITGGNDKDGFPMRQGILVKGTVQYINNYYVFRQNQNFDERRLEVLLAWTHWREEEKVSQRLYRWS